MIKCSNKDKKELISFLKVKDSLNSFFIGDIENFDLEESFIDVYKIYNEKLSSVVLRYFNSYLVYSENDNDLIKIADLINKDKNTIMVSGQSIIINKLSKFINFKKIEKQYLLKCSKETFNNLNSTESVIKAKEKDLKDLYEFKKSIEEFSFQKDFEAFSKEVKTNTGFMYFIKKNNKIVSSATISALNSINGVLIGVATDKEYRNKGYAFSTVNQICKDMIKNNKNIILFYNNENAGRIYKKIGFVNEDLFSMARL